MDDDGETTYETPMLLCFNLNLCLLVYETKNPQHLDFGRSILRASSGIVFSPFVAGIDLTQQSLGGFL